MTRYAKTSTGKYKIKGKVYPKLSGSRAQVWHGTAYKTTGDLTKLNLMKSKNGRIISSKKHKSAKRDNRLVKYGYGARKGKFGAVRLTKRSRRGGFNSSIMNPAPVSGMADDSVSTDTLQERAGMAGGKRHRRRSSSHKRKGGFNSSIMNPAPVSGMADDSVSTDTLQERAGMAGGKRHRRRSSRRRGGRRSRKSRRSRRRRR